MFHVEHSVITEAAYNCVMTPKSKKAKTKKPARPKLTQLERTQPKKTRSKRIARLQASIEDDLLELAEGRTGAEPRWDRPRRERLCIRLDAEVLHWLRSKGPGYQTRINRVLRHLMRESKRRAGE